MARGQIIVDTTQLESVSTKVKDLADKYLAEYTALYNHVQEMQQAWSGTDNAAYTAQIEGFKDDFVKMEGLMREYAEFLESVVTNYRATQDDIKTRAQQLATNA